MILEFGSCACARAFGAYGFCEHPARRIRRTGLAAMVTVYGPSSTAEAMIATVPRTHGQVRGHTPAGVAYCANYPELLTWVQEPPRSAFLRAYRTYACP